jgi:hypothetical protein
MTSIIKVNTIQDAGGNALLTSNGSGTITTNNIGGQNTPAFSVYLSGNQSIGNSSFTKVTFDTEEYDTDNAFASNKFTVPSGQGGKYVFHYSGYMSSLGDDKRLVLNLYKNGSEISSPVKVQHQIYSTGSSSNVLQRTSTVLNLSAGDYIEMYVWQNQGGSINLYADNTSLIGYKLIGV